MSGNISCTSDQDSGPNTERRILGKVVGVEKG